MNTVIFSPGAPKTAIKKRLFKNEQPLLVIPYRAAKATQPLIRISDPDLSLSTREPIR